MATSERWLHRQCRGGGECRQNYSVSRSSSFQFDPTQKNAVDIFKYTVVIIMISLYSMKKHKQYSNCNTNYTK